MAQFCGHLFKALRYPNIDRFNQFSLSVSTHEATCIFLYWSCKQVKLCGTFVLSCLAHFIVFFFVEIILYNNDLSSI